MAQDESDRTLPSLPTPLSTLRDPLAPPLQGGLFTNLQDKNPTDTNFKVRAGRAADEKQISGKTVFK